jgi:hypothetical protein
MSNNTCFLSNDTASIILPGSYIFTFLFGIVITQLFGKKFCKEQPHHRNILDAPVYNSV